MKNWALLPVLQILADLSEMWETLHSETTTFTSPVSAAWKAGQLSIQELAQVGPSTESETLSVQATVA